MGVRDRFRSGLARQLGRPEGLRGRLIGRGLNKGNRTAVTAAVSATSLGPGQAAADVGFGGGIGLQLLLERVGAGGHVDGVELSDTMLQQARRRYRASCANGSLALHAGTLGELPLEDGSLDGLITTNTVYFVENLEQAFGEIARVLRPGGRAVVGIGDPEMMAAMPVTAHGFRVRPLDELVALMRQAGFTDVRHERVDERDPAFHLLIARSTPPID
jgi:arsenite methyltransferase